jgi:hypothetical protein
MRRPAPFSPPPSIAIADEPLGDHATQRLPSPATASRSSRLGKRARLSDTSENALSRTCSASRTRMASSSPRSPLRILGTCSALKARTNAGPAGQSCRRQHRLRTPSAISRRRCASGRRRLHRWRSERACCAAAALAWDEEQTSASARSTPAALLHPWRAAATGGLLLSMHQSSRDHGRPAAGRRIAIAWRRARARVVPAPLLVPQRGSAVIPRAFLATARRRWGSLRRAHAGVAPFLLVRCHPLQMAHG